MRRQVVGAVGAVAMLGVLCGSAAALPMEAIYTGVVDGTSNPFTATFSYNTQDLTRDPYDSDYLDGKSGTVQSAVYTDGTRTLVFDNASGFSKGEYDSTIYDANGDGGIAEIDTIHTFSIMGATGYLSLTFGGPNDMGLYALGTDEADYVNLDPATFTLEKATVTPVPLPSALFPFAGGLVALGLRGRTWRPRRLVAPSA